jgi:hypothetical protein
VHTNLEHEYLISKLYKMRGRGYLKIVTVTAKKMSQSTPVQTSWCKAKIVYQTRSEMPMKKHHRVTVIPKPQQAATTRSSHCAPALCSTPCLPPTPSFDRAVCTPLPVKPAITTTPPSYNPSNPSITQSRHRRQTTIDSHGSGTPPI